jgi:hypothetical protein
VVVEVSNGVREAAQVNDPGDVAGQAKLHCAVQHEPWPDGVTDRPEVLPDRRGDGICAGRARELHRKLPLVVQRIGECAGGQPIVAEAAARTSEPRVPKVGIDMEALGKVLAGKQSDNCWETNGNMPYNVVFPSQFAHLLLQYQRHPEAKSLAPDGSCCRAETRGLLKRSNVIAGEIRYVGKETDRKWEEGDEISLLDFSTTEYGRKGKVVASEEVKAAIQKIGINRCARESGFDRKNFVRKLVRGMPVKRVSYTEFMGWLRRYELSAPNARM